MYVMLFITLAYEAFFFFQGLSVGAFFYVIFMALSAFASIMQAFYFKKFYESYALAFSSGGIQAQVSATGHEPLVHTLWDI